MVPPSAAQDPKAAEAPWSAWSSIESFDSASECQQALRYDQDQSEKEYDEAVDAAEQLDKH
jgi:hypothetical protein